MLPTNILMVKETPVNEYDDYIDNVNIIVNCILGDYNIIVFDRDPADITDIIVNEENTSDINIKCGVTEDTRFVSMRSVGDNSLYISITQTKNILTITASYYVNDERIKNFNLWMDYVIGNTNKDSNFKNVIIDGYDFNNTDMYCDDYGSSVQGYMHLLSAFTKKELRETIFKLQPYLDESRYKSCTRSRLLKHMTGLLEFDSNKQKIINIVNEHSNK